MGWQFLPDRRLRHFGSCLEFENLRAVEGAFAEVSRGHVDYALAQMEAAEDVNGAEPASSSLGDSVPQRALETALT